MELIVFNAVNKLWYITNNKGCGQVSSELLYLCVVSGEKKQIPIWGATPVDPHRTRFFLMPWTNFGTYRVMNVVVKFHRNPMCSFREEVASICGRTDGRTTRHPINSPKLRSKRDKNYIWQMSPIGFVEFANQHIVHYYYMRCVLSNSVDGFSDGCLQFFDTCRWILACRS